MSKRKRVCSSNIGTKRRKVLVPLIQRRENSPEIAKARCQVFPNDIMEEIFSHFDDESLSVFFHVLKEDAEFQMTDESKLFTSIIEKRKPKEPSFSQIIDYFAKYGRVASINGQKSCEHIFSILAKSNCGARNPFVEYLESAAYYGREDILQVCFGHLKQKPTFTMCANAAYQGHYKCVVLMLDMVDGTFSLFDQAIDNLNVQISAHYSKENMQADTSRR